jgi:hypothetical protein
MGEILMARIWGQMCGILILKISTQLFWNMEMKIYPLHVNHALQSFFTTSILLPSLVFRDSTLELECT